MTSSWDPAPIHEHPHLSFHHCCSTLRPGAPLWRTFTVCWREMGVGDIVCFCTTLRGQKRSVALGNVVQLSKSHELSYQGFQTCFDLFFSRKDTNFKKLSQNRNEPLPFPCLRHLYPLVTLSVCAPAPVSVHMCEGRQEMPCTSHKFTPPFQQTDFSGQVSDPNRGRLDAASEKVKGKP